jgi:hypothetical protein
VTAAGRLSPWAALTALAVLLAGTMSISQTLWAKVLKVSGSVGIASWTPTPTETDTPTPTTGEGCSPGYWRQEQHFASWPSPYLPEDSLADALGTGEIEGEPTLLDGLEDGGGGQAAFLRQAVAALLNAAHGEIAYPFSVDEVLALAEAAFATGEFEPVKDMFEAANEALCPLPVEEPEIEVLSVEATASPTAESFATATSSDTAAVEEATPTPDPPTLTPVPEGSTATSEPQIPDEPTSTTGPPTLEETASSE